MYAKVYFYKKMKRIEFLSLSLILTFLISACKKPEYPIENANSYSNVFMQLAADGAITQSLPIKDEWIATHFGVGYGGVNLLNDNVEVDFQVDQKIVDEYNQQNNSDYTLPPSDSYRISETTVTIPAGRTGSNFTSLEINPIKLAGTKSYIIPVSIQTVKPEIPIADNLQTTYFIVNGFYEENPFTPIPIDDWEIDDFSSDDYDAIGGRAPYCIDGDVNTCWLSTYRKVDGWRPGPPHHVTINMNEEHLLHGVTLYGRLGDGQAYLFPKNVQIETSEDGNTWTTAGIYSLVASDDDTSATMYFEESIKCRYFKVTVLSSTGDGDTTAIAELVAF